MDADVRGIDACFLEATYFLFVSCMYTNPGPVAK